MALVQVGYRRLYDALGCSLKDGEELQFTASMGKLEIKVNIGSHPRLGIAVITNTGKYVIPGEASPLFTTEYKKDASESSYPRSFFTEIFCVKQIEVSQELSDLYIAKDSDAQNEILRFAEENSEVFKTALDLVAGTIGLRFHWQFVAELINENFFSVRDENDWPLTITSPSVQLLDGISLNPQGMDMLTKYIQAVSLAETNAQQFAASALTWLLRAWPERDSISKFLALFTPIEIVLEGYGGNPEYEKTKKENIDRIRDLILTHGAAESKQLLKFFNHIAGNVRPSLVSRFEQLAKEAKIDGWESDVVAFKQFNSMRNKLLHRGDPKVRLATAVSEQEIQEETRHLEDIAERYVSWALFGDGVVYPSQWRTKRQKSNEGKSLPNPST